MTDPVSAGPATVDPAAEFEAPYRVRFDEAGPDGNLRTSGLLRYAQDIAWLHSDDRGFGRAWYGERALAWLVRAAEVEVLAPIPLGTTVAARTRILGQRRIFARRRGEFRLPDGTLAGWVHTDWVLIDGNGSLVRIPAVFGEAFRMPAIDSPIGRVPLPPTPGGALRREFTVRPHELDPMDHANNAVYVDWLEESVLAAAGDAGPEAIRAVPRRYRLEYAAAAGPADELTSATWPDDGGWCQRLSIGAGSDLLRARLTIGPGLA